MLREGVKNTYIYNIVIWLYGLRSQKSGVTEWTDCYEYHAYSYLIFVIFLHGQNFWRVKFTPKNANF